MTGFFRLAVLCVVALMAACATDIGGLNGADSGNLNDAGMVQMDVSAAPVCTPACRTGFTCTRDGCVQNCNPACGVGQVCRFDGTAWGCETTDPDAGVTPTDTGVTPPVDSGTPCVSGRDCSDRCEPGFEGRTTCSPETGCTCMQRPVQDAGMPVVDAGAPATDIGGPVCLSGQTNCAGTCVNLLNDNTNCGACGLSCGAGMRCSVGACVPDCVVGQINCGGTCVNTGNSVTHCGACGNACQTRPNTAERCVSGTCGFVCITGFADRDGNPANGCEVNLLNDNANCGAVGHVCASSVPNGASACVSGVCTFGCNPGYADRDGNPANGCEVNLQTDRNNCGTVGNGCVEGRTCCGGVCVNLEADRANCGTCGTACAGARVCLAGQCTGTCAPSAPTCGGVCVDTNVSLDHCGACGNRCTAPANARVECRTGTCAMGACFSGYGNCDGNAANGCEANLETSVTHCGACGNTCPTGANAVPVCSWWSGCGLGCSAGYGNCDRNNANGCEINLQTDNANCGFCGNTCRSGESCDGGTCRLSCPTGRRACFGVCTNIQTDPTNCGDCNVICSGGLNATAACVRGACTRTCATGFGECDGNASTGCETDLRASVNNCGACGNRCATGQTCTAGVCTTPCPTGQTLCGGVCLNLQTNVDNCGTCGNVCPTRANAVAACNGSCRYVCNASFGDCNSNAVDGCEVNLFAGDVNNCGACGRSCPSGQSCSAGICVTPGVDAGTDSGTDASVDGGLFPGERMLFIQGGSSTPDGGTVSPAFSACRSRLVIMSWNAHRSMLSSAAGGAFDHPMTPGHALVKFSCDGVQINLCAEYAAGRRTIADLLGPDAIVRVNGVSYALTNAPIGTDVYAGGCAVYVAITETPGSMPVGAAR